jgi:hypothetical protein
VTYLWLIALACSGVVVTAFGTAWLLGRALERATSGRA